MMTGQETPENNQPNKMNKESTNVLLVVFSLYFTLKAVLILAHASFEFNFCLSIVILLFEGYIYFRIKHEAEHRLDIIKILIKAFALVVTSTSGYLLISTHKYESLNVKYEDVAKVILLSLWIFTPFIIPVFIGIFIICLLVFL